MQRHAADARLAVRERPRDVLEHRVRQVGRWVRVDPLAHGGDHRGPDLGADVAEADRGDALEDLLQGRAGVPGGGVGLVGLALKLADAPRDGLIALGLLELLELGGLLAAVAEGHRGGDEGRAKRGRGLRGDEAEDADDGTGKSLMASKFFESFSVRFRVFFSLSLSLALSLILCRALSLLLSLALSLSLFSFALYVSHAASVPSENKKPKTEPSSTNRSHQVSPSTSLIAFSTT